MPDWVLAVERAYVAAAIAGRAKPTSAPLVAAAIASRAKPASAALAGATRADRPPANSPLAIGGPASSDRRAHAIAAAGAVASRYLAVGTPRSLGLIIDVVDEVDAAALSVIAHRTWFDPRDLRCAATTTGAAALAAATGGRIVPVAEALACDIVNVHAARPHLAPAQLRRGTHVNLAWSAILDPELLELATIVHESDLPALAAGLIDGRQLDEITICILDGAPLAASPT